MGKFKNGDLVRTKEYVYVIKRAHVFIQRNISRPKV